MNASLQVLLVGLWWVSNGTTEWTLLFDGLLYCSLTFIIPFGCAIFPQRRYTHTHTHTHTHTQTHKHTAFLSLPSCEYNFIGCPNLVAIAYNVVTVVIDQTWNHSWCGLHYITQCSSMSVSHLEPTVRDSLRREAPNVRIVYFNKGLWKLAFMQ